MTELTEQLAALRTGAAFAPLTDRAFLRITGSDAARWLNGMVTNNIKDLKPGEGNYNFLLNAQGRIQGDCTIYREPAEGDPTYLLETDKSQVETIQHHLDKFIIMDDVELTPALTDKTGVLLVGPGALATLDVLNAWPTPPVSVSAARDIFGNPVTIDGDPLILSVAKDHYEFWGDQTTVDWIRSSGDPQASPEALEAFRILEARPAFGIDIRTTDLPQETAQQHALHFNKGCYLGQEIVERIRSRGQVHRTFTQFALEGSLPTLPAPLTADGKPAGELTSAAEVDGRLLALGYVRRELASKPLSYDGGIARSQDSETQKTQDS